MTQPVGVGIIFLEKMTIRNSTKRPWAATLIFFSGMFLVACDQSIMMGFSTIGEITQRPTTFENREIKLKGTVSQLLKIPLFETKVYRLKDATGEVIVRTNGLMAAAGDEVIVLGYVDNPVIIGDQSPFLMVRETKHLPVGLGGISWQWPWK